jgi:hypothetical protein
MIDIGRMAQIAAELYFPMVEEKHGQKGTQALREILEFLQALYKYVAPETRSTRIVVFRHIDQAAVAAMVGSVECISAQYLPNLSADPIVIQLRENGRLLLSQTAQIDPVLLAQESVVYTFEHRVERFYAKNEVRVVTNPAQGYPSVFAVPTFDSLKTALEEYKSKQARKSSCKILATSWKSPSRILFKKAPESTMRDSLTQFLKICLRGDVEVRPEQVVDETHPADIKVTWFMSNRLAFIEVKWLGAAKTSATKLTRYSESRARSGAKQLADYLDGNASQAPTHQTRGYLIVLDGRRGKIKSSTTKITHENGFKYENKEILYSPEYHQIRTDFEVPMRMFMEPVCQP